MGVDVWRIALVLESTAVGAAAVSCVSLGRGTECNVQKMCHLCDQGVGCEAAAADTKGQVDAAVSTYASLVPSHGHCSYQIDGSSMLHFPDLCGTSLSTVADESTVPPSAAAAAAA